MAKIGYIHKDGPITKAIREAIKLWHELIAGGTSVKETDRIVGLGLKGALGNPRPIPWRFYCEKCHDTGWVGIQPSPLTMERLVRLYGDNPQYQDYVEKCEPCAWTQKQRNERRFIEGDDGFESAGRTRKGSR